MERASNLVKFPRRTAPEADLTEFWNRPKMLVSATDAGCGDQADGIMQQTDNPTQRENANKDLSRTDEFVLLSREKEPFVDVRRAAAFISMREKTLLSYARTGLAPAYPIGSGIRKKWKFRLSELERWLVAEVNSTQRLRPVSRRVS